MELIPLNNLGYITQISNYLFLSDIECSQNLSTLTQNNIKHIINLSNAEKYQKFDTVKYFDINIDDDTNSNISIYFDKCIEIINNCVNNYENILIHCVCGVSRSVTIVIAYLISNSLTLNEALIHVKKLRNNQYTQPNIGFFKQLLHFEKKYFKKNSLTLCEYVKIIKNITN